MDKIFERLEYKEELNRLIMRNFFRTEEELLQIDDIIELGKLILKTYEDEFEERKKAVGGSGVVIFDPAMTKSLVRKASMPRFTKRRSNPKRVKHR